ncbi:MAG: hypothetical protein VKM34_07795 [Cyanobacteriota bacterium]|nr:hypothetical protein [Cyanobacteriota bacterium]
MEQNLADDVLPRYPFPESSDLDSAQHKRPEKLLYAACAEQE